MSRFALKPLPKAKVRFAALCVLFIFIPVWSWICAGLLRDYQDLLDMVPIVRVSVISLWVPLGSFGALILLIIFAFIGLYTGRNARSVIGERWTSIVNKIALYLALAGVAFAAGWTYHSIDLLEKYGYVYSRNLTKITPTGIHLMYIKATH
ncbi:hypothetical protein [Vibrio brasiliensis]